MGCDAVQIGREDTCLTLAIIYQITWCHKPEFCNLNPGREQKNSVEKHYLTLFRPIRKPTSVFIIYIHNTHYIILISMRLQQMVHAHGHWHPPNAKCSLHLQYPHLQGTVPNQVQGLIYLDLYITVLTWPGWFPNTCCNVAINLRECRGTTRSSWSAVSSKAAGYWNKRK